MPEEGREKLHKWSYVINQALTLRISTLVNLFVEAILFAYDDNFMYS